VRDRAEEQLADVDQKAGLALRDAVVSDVAEESAQNVVDFLDGVEVSDVAEDVVGGPLGVFFFPLDGPVLETKRAVAAHAEQGAPAAVGVDVLATLLEEGIR